MRKPYLYTILFCSITILLLNSCEVLLLSQTNSREILGMLENNEITEASGLVVSQRNENVLWTHNDSGDRARIFALGMNGQHLGTFNFSDIEHRDWEDIALGPGPNEKSPYLYLGDIGDNRARHARIYIYRLPEPLVKISQAPIDTILSGIKKITLRYPDGQRDAETLLSDPITRDLYIISKREQNVSVYKIPYPQSLTEVITMEKIGTLPMTTVTGGDISISGTEILVRNYRGIYYWKRSRKQTVAEALSAPPEKLPYSYEPQGEAVAWHPDLAGYYTVSEEPAGLPAYLYFYPWTK